MDFFYDMDKLIYEIKKDIKFIEGYLSDMEDDNISFDIWVVDNVISGLASKINDLYIITEF